MRRRALLGAVLVVLVVWAVSSTFSGGSPHAATTTTPTTTRATTTTTVISGDPHYAVGTITLTLQEPVATGARARTLPTTVLFPAVGPSNAPVSGSATPNRAGGPYPLVVFSEGFPISPNSYSQLLDAWASAGYVVAAPTYPFTDPSAPGGLNESDIINHPADLHFVISSLLQATAGSSGALSGLIRSNQIAVIGQSDGGDVSLAAVSNSCCKDPRITAAIILSGAELTSFGGTYFTNQAAVPLLVVQGTADTVNVPACSVQIYDQALQPKYYLSLLGQSHLSAYLYAGAPQDLVEKVTIDFLNAYLKGSSASLGTMTSDATVAGLAGLSRAPTIGPPLAPLGGTCEGAPT